MPRRTIVTSGLPYSNGRPHVGHVGGALLPADTYVRYLRAAGQEVLYVCGSDDNGVAIEILAHQTGKSPQEVSSFYHQRQRADFEGLGIEFDVYGGTHQPGFQDLHERMSRDFFLRIYEKGYFVKRETQQLYDARNQRFLPDRYVRGLCPICKDHETYGDQCEKTGAVIDALHLIDPVSVLPPHETPIVRRTAHWYLRLGQFEQPLRQWLESKQGQWRAAVLNFALGQIKQGLPERAMTRDIQWGIPVPLDDPDAAGKVLYVWFDAPIGYVSFTARLCEEREGDWRGYEKWWCDPDTRIVHFIGEDNTVFHTLIWPAMLMAEGRHQLPDTVVANNYINFRLGDAEEKVSKSRTSQESPVWIEEYLKRFDPDALRYYLTAIAPESVRTAFDPDDFVQRNNAELVGKFGNFVNRTLKFAESQLGGIVPSSQAQTDADRALIGRAGAALRTTAGLIEQFKFRAAIEELRGFSDACNAHIGLRAPWTARKTDPADCNAAIATCIHAIQYLAILAYPFMPRAALRMQRQLGLPETTPLWSDPAPLPAGHRLGKPEILFAQLEPGSLS